MPWLITKNLAQSSLASGYTAGNTTIVVQTGDGSKFDAPGGGNTIALAIGNPPQFFLRATAVSTDTFTVDSTGFDGSTAISVTAGTPVTQVITGKVLQDLLSGDLVQTKVADFSWVNQGTATAVDSYGGFDLTAKAASADDIKILVKSLPATPYTVIIKCTATFSPVNFSSCGMILRDSATGKLITFGISFNSGTKNMSQLYTNPTTYAAGSDPFVISTVVLGIDMWLKLVDDGTHRTYFVSQGRGAAYLQVGQTVSGYYATPNQVGVFCNANTSGAQDVLLRVDSFSIQ